MIDFNDGKIHGWNGGECPVHPKTMVHYWIRNHGEATTKAELLTWEHTDGNGDIIAFYVVKAHREPKVIWVNEYSEDRIGAHFSSDDAKAHAGSNAIRIAVEYREVLK